MDKLKKELYEHIDKYGLQDPRTVAKSQELDVEIVKAMRKER
jgi:hypothetical protein